MGDGAERRTRYDAHGGWLWVRARRERMPAGAARADLRGSGRRLRELGSGASLPFALQAIYLVCLPIAAREGVGSVTSFGYAYLIAAGRRRHQCLVARAGHRRPSDPCWASSPRRVARHVEASSWPALLVVAATAGFFAVAGAEIAGRVLGGAYGDDVGTEIGRLVVALAPYMVASVVLSVSFPLVFVAGRGRRLPAHRARRGGGPRARGARRSGGRRARRPRACARVLDRARVRLDADASPRGPVDDAAAGSRGGRRRGMRAVGFAPAGALLGPAPAVVVGLALATVRSRSFARSDCAPPGTTCENSRDSAGDGRRAVVERARGHARVPPLARRGDLPAPRGHRRRQRLERRKPRCRGQGASRRGTRPAGHESRVCRGHERRDRRSALALRRARHAPQQRHDRRAGVPRAAGRRARARRGRECVVLADRLPRRPGRVWYAGAAFRQGRGHHGTNRGYGQPRLAETTPPYRTDRACGGAMLVSAKALVEIGSFDESLFAYAEDTDWSLRSARAGRRILVVPASVVRHAVSASSGGASSPDTLYYGLRNGLVVADAGPRSARRERGSAGARPPRPISRRRCGRIREAPAREPSATVGATSARGVSDLDHGRRISRCAGGSSPTGSVSASGSGSSLGAGISARRSIRVVVPMDPSRYLELPWAVRSLGARAGRERDRPREPEAPLCRARPSRRACDLDRPAPRGDREMEEHRARRAAARAPRRRRASFAVR